MHGTVGLCLLIRTGYASYAVTLPAPARSSCAERLGFLYNASSSAGKPQDIHPSSRNRKVSVTLSGGQLTEGGLHNQCLTSSSGTIVRSR